MENQNNLYFDSEEEARKILKQEGKTLEKIAIKIWRQYLASYKPKKYVRTGNSEKAIKLNEIKVIGTDELGIELTWENDLAWHPSVVPTSSEKGHAIILISNGWHSKKLEKIYRKSVYRHTYYEGYGYIQKVIQAYEAIKDKRITLELIQKIGKR